MKNYKSILACVLALLLVFVNGNIAPTVSAEGTGKNITDRVTKLNYDFAVKKGSELKEIFKDGQPVKENEKVEILVGDSVKITYHYTIDKDGVLKSPRIVPTDYIQFEIPSALVAYNYDDSQIENTTPDGKPIIGKPSIVKEGEKTYVRFTFNNEMATYTELKGNFSLEGRLDKEATNIVIAEVGGIQPIPVTVNPRKSTYAEEPWTAWQRIIGDTSPDRPRMGLDNNLLKEGSEDKSTTPHRLVWNIWANFYGLQDKMENLGDDVQNYVYPDKYTHKPLTVVDYMPPGLRVDDTTQITARAGLYAPTKDKFDQPDPLANGAKKLRYQLTATPIADVAFSLKVSEATRSDHTQETLDVFIDRLVEKNKNDTTNAAQGKRTLGIYTQKAAKLNDKGEKVLDDQGQEVMVDQDVIVVVLGEVGGAVTYDGLLQEKGFKHPETKANLDAAAFIDNFDKRIYDKDTKTWNDNPTPFARINEKQREIMKKVYGSGQPVLAWRVSIIQNLPAEKLSSYTNSAELRSPGKDADKEIKLVPYTKISAGAEGSGSVLDINVTKVWANKNDIPAGATVTVQLFADGVETKTIDITPDNNGEWKGQFTKLERYKSSSTGAAEIVYTIKEKPIDGFTSEITGSVKDGFTITNTKKQAAVVEFKVTKKWEGVTANDGYQDLEVKFNVFAKGKDTPATDQPFVLNKTNNWEVIVELPKTDTTNNQDFEYEVREIPVTGYTSKVTGDMVNGFVITNTKNDSQQPQPSLPVPTQPETSPTPEQTSGAQGTTAGQTTTQRDSVPENIPPTTTAATATTPTGTENIDEDDAARGGVTTTPKVSGDGGELPHTGNLPNELFYSIGAFVALMGVLVLLLQKLKK